MSLSTYLLFLKNLFHLFHVFQHSFVNLLQFYYIIFLHGKIRTVYLIWDLNVPLFHRTSWYYCYFGSFPNDSYCSFCFLLPYCALNQRITHCKPEILRGKSHFLANHSTNLPFSICLLPLTTTGPNTAFISGNHHYHLRF